MPDLEVAVVFGNTTADNSSFLSLPTFLINEPVPGRGRAAIIGSTHTSVTLQLPLVVRIPLPLSLKLPPLSMSVLYAPPASGSAAAAAVQVVSLEFGGGHPLHLAAETRNNLTIHMTVHADPGAASCTSAACYLTPAPREACTPCAVGQLVHSLTAYSRTDLSVALAVGGGGHRSVWGFLPSGVFFAWT